MAINWSILAPVSGPFTVPTYGNYGGPRYSDGRLLTSSDEPVGHATPPVDELDALFRFHDIAYDSRDPAVRAEADLALIQGIKALPDDALSAEGSLYAGGAILFSLALITAVNDHPELLSRSEALAATRTALEDIHEGLTHLEPDDQEGLQSWLSSTGSAVVDLI